MSDDLTLREGQRVGLDFEILRQLGSGGMGAVYLVRQISTLRERALKVMRPQLLQRDPNSLRRFVQEARVGARIKSSHIIDVIAAGVDDALGMPWLAMEYLEGKTLEDMMLTRGVPSSADARAVLEQLFHAIGAAHEAGVVHRDLKPENVFLATAASPGVPFTVKVLDFGIAKWVAEDAGRVTDGLLTLLWGAPEQTGPSRDLSPRADVWALGLLMFWLSTGESYWHAERGGQAVLKEILVDPLPLASGRARALGCPRALPEELDRWFARCVARVPGERFADAREASAALFRIELPFPSRARSWREAGTAPSTEDALEATAPAPPASTAAFSNTKPSTTEKTDLVSPVPPSSPSAASRWVLAAGAVTLLSYAAYRSLSGSALATATLPSLPSATASAAPAGMRPIPAGSFSAGPFRSDFSDSQRSPETGPAQATTTRAFFIDSNEVDVDAYSECVRAGACSEAAVPESSPFASLCNAKHPERGQHPVNCVNLAQARSYCKFRGKRLPREAEWERAARGDDGRLYPWGNAAPASCEVAVVSTLCDRNVAPTRAVGSRAATSLSPYGVADMAGNVSEWVEDDFTPSAERSERVGVLRGGGWDNPPERATSTSRSRAAPETADVNRGFRCALSP
jgi:serine/threonine protein kinase